MIMARVALNNELVSCREISSFHRTLVVDTIQLFDFYTRPKGRGYYDLASVLKSFHQLLITSRKISGYDR
jgi:hypothetical protein